MAHQCLVISALQSTSYKLALAGVRGTVTVN